MIFFNVPEARNQLMMIGLVHTLRSTTRSTGVTNAVSGNYSKHTFLCKVKVERLVTVKHPDDLQPYLHYSGFKDVDTWWSKATTSARTVYRVEKLKTYLPEKMTTIYDESGFSSGLGIVERPSSSKVVNGSKWPSAPEYTFPV